MRFVYIVWHKLEEWFDMEQIQSQRERCQLHDVACSNVPPSNCKSIWHLGPLHGMKVSSGRHGARRPWGLVHGQPRCGSFMAD